MIVWVSVNRVVFLFLVGVGQEYAHGQIISERLQSHLPGEGQLLQFRRFSVWRLCGFLPSVHLISADAGVSGKLLGAASRWGRRVVPRSDPVSFLVRLYFQAAVFIYRRRKNYFIQASGFRWLCAWSADLPGWTPERRGDSWDRQQHSIAFRVSVVDRARLFTVKNYLVTKLVLDHKVIRVL